MVTRFLVVEDNELSQAFLKHLIEELGHRVTVVPTAEEALARLESGAIDVMLVSLGLAGDAARRLIEAIARRPEGPVMVAVTGAREGGWDDWLRANGVAACLEKPVQRESLEALLDRLEAGETDRPGPEALLDVEVVKSLKAIARDPLVFEQLVDEFGKMAEDLLARLEAASPAGAWAPVKGPVHSLKGAALNIGATGLADRCRALEQEARPLSAADLAALRASLEDTLAALQRVARA